MPSEMPDRRAVYVLIGIVLMGFIHVASMVLLGQGLVVQLSEWALYGSIGVAGVILGVLSYRDGFSLLKPSRTREETPFSFWFDVAFLSFGLPAVAVKMARDFILTAP